MDKIKETLEEAAVLRKIAAQLRAEAAALVEEARVLHMRLVDVWETTKLRVSGHAGTIRTD